MIFVVEYFFRIEQLSSLTLIYCNFLFFTINNDLNNEHAHAHHVT